MAGMSILQMEAAIITPAAKPKHTFCSRSSMVLRIRNTVAAPRVVIKKVKPVPPAAHSIA